MPKFGLGEHVRVALSLPRARRFWVVGLVITPNGRIRLLPGTDAPVGRAKGSDDLGYALVGPPLEATLPRGMHLLVAMIWKEASGEPELLRRVAAAHRLPCSRNPIRGGSVSVWSGPTHAAAARSIKAFQAPVTAKAFAAQAVFGPPEPWPGG